jgi:hypothetical protein
MSIAEVGKTGKLEAVEGPYTIQIQLSYYRFVDYIC